MADENKPSLFGKLKQLFVAKEPEEKPKYEDWVEIKITTPQSYPLPSKKEPVRNQPRESVRNGLHYTRELTQKRIENEQTDVRDRKRITNSPRVTTEELKKRYPDAFNSK